MAVVKLKYIRNKEQIKANLRYFTHRSGHEKDKITRTIFTNVGETDKQEFYKQVYLSGRGTLFYKFMISPDPTREDSLKDLDLPYITRRTIRKLEKVIGRSVFFVAAVHSDHTPIRHVHGIFLVKGRLSKEQFRALQEVARAEATTGSRLLRRARDIALRHPRYQALATQRRLSLRGRGGGRAPKIQPGCRRCGFGVYGGLPAYKTHCPMCRTSLRQERQVRMRLDSKERRLK